MDALMPIKQEQVGTRLDDAAADHKADATSRNPSSLARKRAQSRAASARRRRLEKAGGRVYELPQSEALVFGALTVAYPGRTDLANHKVQQTLLTGLVDKHLRRVMDDSTDNELKVDINRLLRDFDNETAKNECPCARL